MTEVFPISIIDWREKARDVWHSSDNLGEMPEGIEYELIDSELQIKAPHAMKSYLWQDPKEFIPTWDLIEITWRSLRMIWRKKDMIIRWNNNIYPSLYEWNLLKIHWVRECVFFWVDIGDYNEKVILLVDGTISRADLYRELRSWEFSIDRFAIPDDIIFGKIPRYGRQKKVNKTILQKLYHDWMLWR